MGQVLDLTFVKQGIAVFYVDTYPVWELLSLKMHASV